MKFIIAFVLIAAGNADPHRQDPAADPASDFADTRDVPEDEMEDQIIAALHAGCPDQMDSLVACYGNMDDVMACTNCFWEGISADGEPACTDDLDEKAQSDYAACSESCKSECDDQVFDFYSCGIAKMCNESEEEVLEIA